jgi:oxygen-independent coproporphyrinogen-3 oxidase
LNPQEPLGLYVHVPFCSVKCFYCDFVAFSGKSGQADHYLSALEREAQTYAGPKTTTLYVGGGTPSELTAPQITRMLKSLSGLFEPASGWREATFEMNPESSSIEKFDALKASGVGRISFGLQTPDDDLLRSIGRRHSFSDFKKTFRNARSRGFSISVDLMCALPDQTSENFLKGVDDVLALEPDHLSLYSLSVEDRTLFKKRSVSPDEDLARGMLDAAHERFARAGFEHYEISNFARPGHASAHNDNYWGNGEFIGLGCGAAGKMNGMRYQNEEVFGRYLKKLEAGESPIAERECLSGKEKTGESVWLGLRRLRGLNLSPMMQAEFRNEIEDLVDRGLVDLAGGCSTDLPRLRLTRSGIFLANEVFREFVAPFNDAQLQESL